MNALFRAGCLLLFRHNKNRQRIPNLNKRIPLPPAVAAIYRAVAELEAQYPGRKFTPDGHMVGSIGEVVAAAELGLTLYSMSREGHDAFDADGDVQIKLTGTKAVSMYGESARLVVLRIVSPIEAEVVYDGDGRLAWNAANAMAKNGQRRITLTKLRALSSQSQNSYLG